MLEVYIDSNSSSLPPLIMTLIGKERYYDWYVDSRNQFEFYDGVVGRDGYDTYIGNIPEGLI